MANEGKCGAKRQDGGTCNQPKSFGTSHPGSGRCKFHGGASLNGTKAAVREQVASLATEADVEPLEVLLRSIRLAWGAVEWCRSFIGQTEYALIEERNNPAIDDEDAGAKLKRVIQLEKRLLAFQAIYGDWMDRAAKHAKLALDAGIEERRVRIAEQEASLIAEVIRGILSSAICHSRLSSRSWHPL